MNSTARRTALLASAIVMLLTACTSSGRRRALILFFDGVPPQNTTTSSKTIAKSPADTTTDAQPELPEIYRLARAAPTGVRHRPYAERQCLSCHESQFSQTLRGDVAEICQLCHSSIAQRGPHRHAPVEAGYCIGCHDPHESNERALLVRPVRQLCGDCHDETQVMKTSHHARTGEQACDTCHDPHGGATRTFLKSKADATAAPTGKEGTSS